MDEARVNHRAVARWQRGHPWIFRSDILEVPGAAAGPVVVVSERRRFLGIGLWSPRSQIALRMLTAAEEPIDTRFWLERVRAAESYRAQQTIDATAYRLVHGEADRLPSLIVDRYGDVLVVQLLSAGLEACRESIREALLEVFRPAGILARNDVAVRRSEGLTESLELLHGRVPEEVEVAESTVRYLVSPWTGQKTGAFLDQRENRMRAGELARGRALDCFSYHGSFALHLARRAQEVVALDSSGPALQRAQLNAQLNGLGNVRLVEANVFDYLREHERAGTRFSTIVLDPPAFAKRRTSLEPAMRAYKEVNLRAMRMLEPDGYLVTFSCSHHMSPALFHEMLESAAADARRPLRLIERRGQALDHPEILQIAESAYLKGAILQAS
jgi:23S rRNA (cytosine1962-C5)-methyltransferase